MYTSMCACARVREREKAKKKKKKKKKKKRLLIELIESIVLKLKITNIQAVFVSRIPFFPKAPSQAAALPPPVAAFSAGRLQKRTQIIRMTLLSIAKTL